MDKRKDEADKPITIANWQVIKCHFSSTGYIIVEIKR